jgi:hypothetical protein
MTSFRESAFVACPSLQSIGIPSSVEAISECCFEEYKLSKLTFEAQTRALNHGKWPFARCQSRQPVCIPLKQSPPVPSNPAVVFGNFL